MEELYDKIVTDAKALSQKQGLDRILAFGGVIWGLFFLAVSIFRLGFFLPVKSEETEETKNY